MNKEEIEKTFEADFTNPGSIKSGEYLAEHVLNRAKELIHNDRLGLVEVLRSWILQRSEPRTMLAVNITGELRLFELKEEVDALRVAVKNGECFLPFYIRQIENALNSI